MKYVVFPTDTVAILDWLKIGLILVKVLQILLLCLEYLQLIAFCHTETFKNDFKYVTYSTVYTCTNIDLKENILIFM